MLGVSNGHGHTDTQRCSGSALVISSHDSEGTDKYADSLD